MSLNKVILIGNVGRDPEVRYISDNVPVASFTLATTKRGYKTQDGKEVPEKLNGTTLLFGAVWQKLPNNTLEKELNYILRENCKPAVGKKMV